jgi:hypothetical protein
MTMLGRIAFALVLFGVAAFAQQPAPPSAGEQALSDRLIEEIRSNVQARTQLIETQRKLAEANEKIKALEAKSDQK